MAVSVNGVKYIFSSSIGEYGLVDLKIGDEGNEFTYYAKDIRFSVLLSDEEFDFQE